MAITKNPIQIEGNLAGYSFYKLRGTDKMVVRTKGGPSKNQIKKAPQFEQMRLNQSEWKGCTAFASKLRLSFGGLHRLADFNLTPQLNAMVKAVQKTDENTEKGKRSILFSANRHIIDGFDFNRKYPFDSIIKVNPRLAIDRELLSAEVKIARGYNSLKEGAYGNLPYYRILLSIGAVSDMVFDEGIKMFKPQNDLFHGLIAVHTGEWQLSAQLPEQQEINLSLPIAEKSKITDDVSLVVCIGIEFGNLDFLGNPQAVKYAGCGKVLGCG